MNRGTELRCPACGAAGPVGADSSSRCAFCLTQVEVPASLRRSVAEDGILQRRVEAAARDYGAARSQTRAGRSKLWTSLFWVIMALFLLAISGGVSLVLLYFSGTSCITRATPQSMTMTSPWSPIMMFSGLRSRWSTPWSWA